MLDWFGSMSLLLGTLLLTWKIRIGWLLNAIGSSIFLYVFWDRWALIILQAVFITLAIKGWFSWRAPESDMSEDEALTIIKRAAAYHQSQSRMPEHW